MDPIELELVESAEAPDEPVVVLSPHGESAVVTESAGLASLAEPTASVTLEVVAEPRVPVVVEPRRGLFRRIGGGIASACGWVFGSVSLIGALALLASIPVAQFLSLGYLLEAAGRIGRTGRLRHAFPGVRLASRLGGVLLGGWLVTLPWRYMSARLLAAELIDPSSPETAWRRILVLVLAIITPLHVVLAVSRGGRLRYFFAPLNIVWFVRRLGQGGYLRQAWTGTTSLVRDLRPWHYFSLGFRGYLGAFVWLLIPSTLYAIGTSEKTALLGLLGGILMTIVVLFVPFLQVHFAVENRLRAMFEVGKVRERFYHSPIAFFISLLFTVIVVLPLNLLKIEVVPRDAMWLPAVLFIVTIFPLKVLTGWAYGRAGRREEAGKESWLITRLGCRFLMVPVALIYAIVVFFTQYIGWHGVQALYEHHAFLLPVPF